MDLIAQGVGAMLAFLCSIIGNIFAHDICVSADLVCAKIVRAAANRLAAFDQELTEQEWLADLHDQQTVLEKYRHAVGCLLAAPKMRRFALQAPFVAEAPGLVWKMRPRIGKKVWEARWAAAPSATAAGYKLKGVRIWIGDKTELSAGHRDFVVEVTRQLQTEQDRWLHDPRYRAGLEAEEADREHRFQELIALGHTRAEALDTIWGA